MEEPRPRRPVYMPWVGLLPEFRAQLPGESTAEWFDAKGEFLMQAAKLKKVDWMLDRWLEER